MGPGCGGRGKGKPVWPPGESSSLLTSHFQALAVSCEEESDFTGTDSGQHPKVDRCHDHSSSCREVNSENMSLMGGGGGVAAWPLMSSHTKGAERQIPGRLGQAPSPILEGREGAYLGARLSRFSTGTSITRVSPRSLRAERRQGVGTEGD